MRSLVLVLTCLLPACRATEADFDPAAKRPNVVLILADDLGWGELGCYGQERIRTPNLDRLASQGMRFTQCYSGAPVCAPCRNVLMTGRHLGHVTDPREQTGARTKQGNQIEGQHPIPAEALTIAEVFRDQGYVTGCLSGSGASVRWVRPVTPTRRVSTASTATTVSASPTATTPPHLWANRREGGDQRGPDSGSRQASGGGHHVRGMERRELRARSDSGRGPALHRAARRRTVLSLLPVHRASRGHAAAAPARRSRIPRRGTIVRIAASAGTHRTPVRAPATRP